VTGNIEAPNIEVIEVTSMFGGGEGRSASAGGKPNLPICHICGRQFGSASLAIHMKSCAEKYERERGKPPPSMPSAFLGEDRPIGKRMSAEEVDAYNEAAYSAWSGDLVPCPHCQRKFLPDRLPVHLRGCDKRPADAETKTSDGLTEWERAQGKKSAGEKKQLPFCHLCGRQFGTASLKIHLKECAKKYEREKGRPAPPAPEMLNMLTGDDRPIGKGSAKAWEEYNEAAWAAAQSALEPCPHCGRTFSGKDRLAVHLRSCRPKEAPAQDDAPEGSPRELAEKTVEKWKREAAAAKPKAQSARGAKAGAGAKSKAMKTDREKAIKPGGRAVAKRRWDLAAAVEAGLDPSVLEAKATAQEAARVAQREAIMRQVGGMIPVCDSCDDGPFDGEENDVEENDVEHSQREIGSAHAGAARTLAAVVDETAEHLGRPPAPPANPFANRVKLARSEKNLLAPTPPVASSRADSPASSRRASSPRGSRTKKKGASSPHASSKPMGATAPEPPAAAAGKGPGLTVRERMLQLNELLDAGLVTKQEFEAKRQVILDAL
jgi:hypothetical protein